MNSSFKVLNYIRKISKGKPIDYISGADAVFNVLDTYNNLGKGFPDEMKKYDVAKNILAYRNDITDKKMFDEGARNTLTFVAVATSLGRLVDEKGEEMEFITFDLAEDAFKKYIEAVGAGL